MGFTQLLKSPTTDQGTLLDHVYCSGALNGIVVEVSDTYYSDHDAVYSSHSQENPLCVLLVASVKGEGLMIILCLQFRYHPLLQLLPSRVDRLCPADSWCEKRKTRDNSPSTECISSSSFSSQFRFFQGLEFYAVSQGSKYNFRNGRTLCQTLFLKV